MEFNEETQQYELEIDDVTSNTNYTAEDIAQHGIDLRDISRNTYRVLYNFYVGPQAELHRKNIDEYIIDKDKKYGLMLVMIEYLKGAIISGMDLNAYSNEFMMNAQNRGIVDKPSYSYTVKQEARSQGLYFPGGLLV